MYRYKKTVETTLTSVEKLEGEPIEHKIERIVSNKEPITDGAPSIFTERSEGVVSAYNIRTDRWEIATEAMDKVQGSIVAKREAKASIKTEKEDTSKVVDMSGNEVSEAKSTEASKEA